MTKITNEGLIAGTDRLYKVALRADTSKDGQLTKAEVEGFLGQGRRALESVFEQASKTGDAVNLEGGFDKALARVMAELVSNSKFEPYDQIKTEGLSPAAQALAEFTASTVLSLSERAQAEGLARLSEVFKGLIKPKPAQAIGHEDVVKYVGFERDAMLEVSEAIMAKTGGWDSKRPFTLQDVDDTLREFGANMRRVANAEGDQNRVLEESEMKLLQGRGLEVARYINLTK